MVSVIFSYLSSTSTYPLTTVLLFVVSIFFQIKTTSPDKYRVRPSSGQINPGASVSVDIIYLGGKRGGDTHLYNHTS